MGGVFRLLKKSLLYHVISGRNVVMDATVIFITKESTTVPCAGGVRCCTPCAADGSRCAGNDCKAWICGNHKGRYCEDCKEEKQPRKRVKK